jgi:hypothetical protein
LSLTSVCHLYLWALPLFPPLYIPLIIYCNLFSLT